MAVGVEAAQAQEARDLGRVVVQGVRASAETAEARRRESLDIVDAVVAAEIHKLPDLSVGDAVQRITGVQVARDRGEASVFAVRGLTQVETTLNGREVFTAGSGRTLDLADFAAEMLAGIDVHKTAAAERLEGGVGGSVDLRTRRPFDFPGDATVLSARTARGHLVGRHATQGSALLSRRLRLRGEGEFGLLLNVVVQERAWREDQKSTGNPVLRSDLVPGTTVVAPNGTSETVSLGTRRRHGATLIAQWRPHPTLEWHAEVHLAELKTRQDSHQINVTAGSGFVPGSVQLFDGTSDLRRVTWTDAPLSVLSFARDTVDRTRQFALGGRHDRGDWIFSGDLSHTRGSNRLYFSGPFFASRAAEFTHDLSGRVPSTKLGGTDLLNPANLSYTGLAYRARPFHGELSAARLDAQWQGVGGAVERVAVGWRTAVRRADNVPGLVFGDVPLSGLTAADTPGRVVPNSFGDFLDGRATSIGGFLIGTLGDARDAAALREAFGITAPLPAVGNPLSVWRIRERTDAGYAQVDWRVPGLPLVGHAGLRAVRTGERVDGTQSVPSTGAVAPLRVASAYTDWLPSAALRWRLDGGVQLRAAASRTITRPNFEQLSPSLTLVPNPINPALNVGAAGNPDLRPVRSRNLDLAAESVRGDAGAWSMTLFWKQVDGFVANASQPETWDGVVYQVSRPYNSDPARIRGVELAGLRFLDELPGAWRGLGVQANYTFVDSSTPDRRLGVDVPLQNLSRHSANLIGLYEHGPWSARLAWNWRSRFLSGVNSVVGLGAQPVYTRANGWLDGAIGWRIDDRITLTLEASNLLRTMRTSFTGVPTRPQSAWANDRQWALGVSVAL
ncbi:MAG TPA: TonB-dependent receptor [Methylibium sp.]|nr:TonB-dependent receptor [Methylibium sp.]